MNSKDLLAKLLAEENITILRESVSTASFDIVNRILRLPVWKDMSSDVEDLLIAHEISHAKYSFPEFFVRSDITGLKRTILNIIEDNRIERFIKNDYPIYKSIFSKAYKELWDNDFFGDIENHKLLIDRINVYSKVGTLSGITFTEEEQRIFDRVNSTQSPKDCLELLEELYNLTLEEVKDDKVNPDIDPVSSQDGNAHSQSIDEDDIDSNLSYNKFEKTISELADTESEYFNYTTDKKFNFYGSSIVGYEKIIKDIISIVNGFPKNRQESYRKFEEDESFIEDTRSQIMIMVKEFEMRKRADEYKRISVSKTGELNTKKLFQYKLSDNIFRTRSVVKEGKNHGLILLIDWSGSMSGTIMDVVNQVINLVLFCRKVNIPFRVYAFTDIQNSDREPLPEKNIKDLLQNGIHLLELFSDEMTNIEFKNMMNILRSRTIFLDDRYKLSKTPLTSSLLYINDISYNFKQKYGIDKLSLILMTDGDDTQGLSVNTKLSKSSAKKTVISIIDSKTKLQYTMSNDFIEMTKMMLQMNKDRNKCKVINFYLTVKEEELVIVKDKYSLNNIDVDKYMNDGFYVTKSEVFDQFFFIDSEHSLTVSSNIDLDDIDDFETLADAFNYSSKIIRKSRILLSKFIEEIS